ncbi:MAG: helix-turn-helix transcriptional regulator [Labilithrix sp.]|nr:helix-turn-helix transcriptional regulator [Labilithrix sp.]MCW5810740.1 helix-turn-helix transcriptional regulator [Labilithrix sp.]
MRTVRSKADWVEVLDAAYDAAEDDTAWGRRLLDVGARVFRDAQLLGVTMLAHDASCSSAEIVLGLGPPAISRDVLAATRQLGMAFVREHFYPPSLVTTHLEVGVRMQREARERAAALRASWGCVDGLGLCVHPDPGLALVFYAGFDRELSLSARERRLLTQLALHVETSCRLRRRPDVVTAVIGADGRLLHRGDDAPRASSMSAHVARIERARTRSRRRTTEALDLWSALVDGRATLVPRSEGSRRHYLVVDNAPATQPLRALTHGELDALSFAARGLSSKLIGYSLGVSEPTVSSRLASAAAKVGLATRIELVRLAAMLTRDPRARFERMALTTAERDVLALLAQGLSNRDIARIRRRSVRTIANQVAHLLRKTSTSSRRALALRLS